MSKKKNQKTNSTNEPPSLFDNAEMFDATANASPAPADAEENGDTGTTPPPPHSEHGDV